MSQVLFAEEGSNTPNFIISKKVAFCAYMCIVSGASLGMGLVHAGTCDAEAKAVLLNMLKTMQRYLLACN